MAGAERRTAEGQHPTQAAGRAEKPPDLAFLWQKQHSPPHPGVMALQLPPSMASTGTAVREEAGPGPTAARPGAEAGLGAQWPATPCPLAAGLGKPAAVGTGGAGRPGVRQGAPGSSCSGLVPPPQ